MKTTKLFSRCTANSRGGTILPGSLIHLDEHNPSDSTLRRWVRWGWIIQRGDFYVLTHLGYKIA